MQDACHLLTAGGTLTAAITVFSVLVLLLGDLLDEKNDAMAAVGRAAACGSVRPVCGVFAGYTPADPQNYGSAVYLFPVLRRLPMKRF